MPMMDSTLIKHNNTAFNFIIKLSTIVKFFFIFLPFLSNEEENSMEIVSKRCYIYMLRQYKSDFYHRKILNNKVARNSLNFFTRSCSQ